MAILSNRYVRGAFLVGLSCVLPAVIQAQALEPIPLPATPNTKISNLNSATGYVRVKANPDECWTGLGLTPRWDFINQTPGQQPCLSNQIPKTNQGYIWGQTVVGDQIFFGTFANAECLGIVLNNSNPTPVVLNNAYTCEYSASQYSNTHGGPLPPALADDRPPRMYVYNISTKTIRDITPKLNAALNSSLCQVTQADPLCIDILWQTMVGVRSATSYVEPTTGKTYVIVSGQAFVNGPSQNAINFYMWGVTENRWVAKYQYVGYADVRHWVSYQGSLYAAAFKPAPVGGALVRYTGSMAVVPPPTTPSAANQFSTIPSCGTTSSAIPPVSTTGVCLAFEDVGDFDTPGSEVAVAPAGTADAGRIFVGTWPPSGANPNSAIAGIYMSPVVPAGGLTSANAASWSKVWDASNYDPDPLLRLSYGMGSMTFYNGYLYWGTLNPPLASVNSLFTKYGTPTGSAFVTDGLQANRTSVLFRAQGFSTTTPKVDLLYGEAQLPVYIPANPSANPPTDASFQLTPNNVASGACTTACGTAALFGHSGFNHIYNNYMWSMLVSGSRLYVGTMNWELLAGVYVTQNQIPLPSVAAPQPGNYGANLYYFADTSHAAIPLSTTGVGNFLNYGIRNLIPYSSTMFFVGTANPMNIATSGTTNITGAACNVAQCRGGWELIEVDPTGSSTVVSR